jgi:alanine racemase
MSAEAPMNPEARPSGAGTGAEAFIDLAAYAQNLETVRAAVRPATVMAVVKADGYGHGLLPIARAAVASGINWIGTLDIATGLQLRAAGIKANLFAWLLGPNDDLLAAIDARIDLGVSSIAELDRVADAAAAVPARLHLKIDTGLHRNGATEAEWPEFVERALELEREGRADLFAVWTHIAEASEQEDSEAIERFERAVAFAAAKGVRVRLRHLAASAASLARADSRFDLVRVGAFGYGISPGGRITPHELGLIPVMTLSAAVVGVDDGFAELAIGYANGISSGAAGVLGVAIGGTRYPIVSVRLDRVVVEVGDSNVAVGERGILFGPGDRGEATLQEWGDALESIGEEVVTRLTALVVRRYN